MTHFEGKISGGLNQPEVNDAMSNSGIVIFEEERRKLKRKDIKTEKKCIVLGCPSSSETDPTLRFCTVPRNTNSLRFKKWADFAQNPAIFELRKFLYMCERHFLPKLFSEKRGSKLKRKAIPTLHGPPKKAVITLRSPHRRLGAIPKSTVEKSRAFSLQVDHKKTSGSPKLQGLEKEKSLASTSEGIQRKIPGVLLDHEYSAHKHESEEEESADEVLDEKQATQRIYFLMEKVEKLKMENFKLSKKLKELEEENDLKFVFLSPDRGRDSFESDDEVMEEDRRSDDDDYEVLNKQQCKERIEKLTEKVNKLLKDITDLKKENVLLNISNRHKSVSIESMRQCGRDLILKANSINQADLATFQKEREILQTNLKNVSEELATTKEENNKLKQKIEELEVSLKTREQPPNTEQCMLVKENENKTDVQPYSDDED